MRKHNNSGKKSEPTSKPTKSLGLSTASLLVQNQFRTPAGPKANSRAKLQPRSITIVAIQIGSVRFAGVCGAKAAYSPRYSSDTQALIMTNCLQLHDTSNNCIDLTGVKLGEVTTTRLRSRCRRSLTMPHSFHRPAGAQIRGR